MATLRLQATFQSETGLPEDVFINTWHVTTGPTFSAAPVDYAGALADFYTQTVGTTAPYGMFSDFVAQNNHSIKVYDLADPEPRAPLVEYIYNLPAAPGGAALPNEVALCLSFQAEPASGITQARRRGRVFFGPLNNATGAETDNDFRPTQATREDLRDSLMQLFDDIANIEAGAALGIWSPTQNAFAIAHNGWIDNAYDTQRRRGLAPSARTSWAF